jgi:ABC-2 type transport system ATP-binding protein
MNQLVLKAEKIKKYFHINKVIDGISFDVKKGEVFGIIGASGSGKTTLLKLLIGFLPLDSGNVFFNVSTTETPNLVNAFNNSDMIKKKFGFAAQYPSFYEKLTVSENLDYFGALYGLGKEARLNNISTLLDLVELSHAKDIVAKNLSGGMKRRLDIACSLIHNPDILILDEPTSDLDLVLSKQIWDLIRKINKKGTTIIVASHDLPEVETICSRIGILANGKIEKVGSLDSLKNTVSKGQEIHLETYPGNYEEIAKKINIPIINKIENTGNSLVITTQKPDKVLVTLLKVLEKENENLLDLKISKLSLKDVFTKITKK